MAKYVMAENRRSLTPPQFFKAIVFLKFDEIFRDAQLVSDDVNGARAALFEARRKALELEQENFHH